MSSQRSTQEAGMNATEYATKEHGKTCAAMQNGYPDLGCKGCRAILAVRRAIKLAKGDKS